MCVRPGCSRPGPALSTSTGLGGPPQAWSTLPALRVPSHSMAPPRATSIPSPPPPAQPSQDPRGTTRAGVHAPRPRDLPFCRAGLEERGGEALCGARTLTAGPGGPGGPSLPFSPSAPCKATRCEQGTVEGGHPTIPRQTSHSPLDQEVLGLQGSLAARGDRLFQEGRRGRGHPGIGTTGQIRAMSMAQVDGKPGGAWSSRSTRDLGWSGASRGHGFKRNLWVLTCFTVFWVWALEHGPSSHLGACTASWPRVWRGDRLVICGVLLPTTSFGATAA